MTSCPSIFMGLALVHSQKYWLLRSAEKARKGKTSGPINCSPENITIKRDPESEYIMIKQEHTYVTGDIPDIGPDPLNTTDYRGNERNQPHQYNGATRYARSTIPQYYYTDELPQGKDNITRFKPEPPNGPA